MVNRCPFTWEREGRRWQCRRRREHLGRHWLRKVRR